MAGASIGDIVAHLKLEINDFQNNLNTATDKVKQLSENFRGTEAAGKAFSTVGTALTAGVTAPVMAIGASVVKTQMQFQDSMAKVQALSGATGAEFDKLKETAMEWGEKTKYSASECADALGYMSLAGWDATQSASALPGVLNLAASSGMELAQASDLVTDYLTAFGLEADQAGRMADVLSYAQANSNTTTQQLGEAFKNCAVNAHNAGMSLEETTAILGKLADQGLKGSEAGTALNAVIRDMTNKMKNGNIQIGNTKVAVQDANGNFRSMTDIVRDVSKATEGMGDAEKMAALQTTFTADSIKAMGIMCNTGADSIDGFTKELENSEGSAKKTADTMNNTLSGAITELGSAWEGFKLRLADSTGILTQLVKGLTAIVRAASKIPAPIKQIIVTLALFAAAIGPTLLGIGKLMQAWVKMKEVIGILKVVFGVLKTKFLILKSLILDTLIPALSSLWAFMLANPITLVIAAIVALIAIFVVLYNKCEWFRNAVNNLWSSIKSAIQPAIDGIKKGFMQLVEGIMKAWENIKQVCEGIKEVFEGIWDMDPQKVADGFTKIFTNLSQIIPNLLQGLGNMILTILQGLIQAMFNLGVLLGQWVVNGVINLCNNVIQCIATFITNVGQFLAKLPQVVWFWLCFIVTQVGQWVVNMVQKAGEMGSQFITNVGQWLSQLPQNIWNWLISTLTTVGLWATQFIQWAIQAGSQFLSNIVNFFSNLPATIWYWLCYVISYVALWTAQMIQKGIEAGTQFVTNVINWIQQLPGRIWTWLVDTVTKVQTWASQMIAKAQQAGSQFLQRVSTYIQQLPGRIATWLSSVISRVASWASQMASKAQQAGSQFLQRVCTYIQQLPGRIASFLSSVISRVASFASNFASKGAQAARNFSSKIISGLAGLPGKMASIGRNIVQGIINGISSGAGALFSKMKEIASNALNAAKGALGIKSPSRAFRDQVGKFIPSGIAVGIQANTDSAIDSVKKLANSLVASVDMNNLSKSMKLATSGIDIDTTNNYDNNNMIGTMRQLINEVQSIKFEFDYKKMGEQMKEAVSCQNSVVYMDSDIVGKKVAKPVKEYNDFTMNRLSRFRGDKDDL